MVIRSCSLDLFFQFPLLLGVVERSLSPHISDIGFVGKVLVHPLGSLGHVLEVPSLVSLINLSWSHNLVMWVVQELVPMCEPSSDSWQGEQDGEHLSWDTQSLVDHTRVEVDVHIYAQA